MIFTGIKRKTNQIFFNRKLQEDSQKSRVKKVVSLNSAIVFIDNNSHRNIIESFLSQSIGIAVENIDFLIYSSKKIKDAPENVYFKEDFGWYGRLKSDFIKEILTKKVDLLINYSKIDNIYTDLLILQSKATLKTSLAHQNHELFDLLIKCQSEDFEVFHHELNKYLTILKN